MKERQLKKQLQQYPAPLVPIKKLQQVQADLQENYQPVPKGTFFPFFVFRHISLKIWLWQGSIMALAIYSAFILHHLKTNQLLGLLTGVTLLIALSCFPEILRSWQMGMWELEAVCRYETRQIVLGKIIFLGLVDSGAVALLALTVNATLQVSFLQAFIYFLTPFNLLNIFCYSFSLKKIQPRWEFPFYLSIGGLVSLFMVALSLFGKIYQVAFSYWLTVFVLSCATVLLLIKKFYQMS